jgi:DNA primase catalytic core
MSRLKGSTLQVSGFLDEFEKDQVKKDVDILSLFSSFGISLQKKGNSHMGLCPFHDDKEPSLSVDQAKGLFHCFGCGESGDVFDLVMKIKGIGFKESLAYLKNDLPISSPEPKAREIQLPTSELSEAEQIVLGAVEEIPLDKADLNSIIEYYQGQLSKTPEALEYLKGRKLLDWELLNRLKIGFAPGTLRSMVSDKQFQVLKEAGVFSDKGKEAFAGCIVFPLLDESGQVVSLYGRKISSRSKVQHLYLKGPHRGLFNGKAFKAYPERMILTESVIDALSLMIMGFQNVSACYGANGFTEDHLRALKDNRTQEVVIAFDCDNAGINGAEALAEKLVKEGISLRIVYPHAELKDWNISLQADFSKGEFEELLKESTLREPAGKKRIHVEEKGGKYYFHFAEITYRLIGVKEGFVSSLKVNVRAEKEEDKHIDNVDLFSARSRSTFSLVLGRLFSVEAARVEKDLVAMLEWLEEERDRKLLGLDDEGAVTLTADDKRIGLELLQDPNLFERIEADLSALGYVGEASNKKLMYLAASSRKLQDPISIIVISQSAAGKSYLIDTVKKLIPPEEVLSMTSLSDQALNYLPEEALLHKFMVMGEAVHSESVDHQMREMLSAQELSRLVTTKDEKTGRMVSRLVRKKAVVSAVMSSATGEINPENASRCFVISTDESEEQTRAIHREQRKKYSLARFQTKAKDLPSIVKAHHAAQRLLKDRMMINSFADHLDFPATLMRSRRDHERFMDLIASVCFLRQYQKEEIQEGSHTFIECDLTDYRIAYDIMMSILPSTLSNFPKSAQLLYEKLRELIRQKAEKEELSFNEVSLSQREMREKTGLSHDVVKWNLRHLVEYEYVRKIGGVRRGQSGLYRIDRDEDINSLLSSGIPTPETLTFLVGQSGVME